MTDTELVTRTREGDTSAFGELVERYQQTVYRAARAALRSPEEAEEVAQEAFIAAFWKLGEFRGEASFKTWLLAIAWNVARTRRRTLGRWLQRFTSSDERPASDPQAPGATHEEQLIKADLRRQVRRVVATLSPKYREVMLLAASDEHTLEEIGSILGVPTGTVKWRMSEGRRLLKMKLARLGIRHD